MSKYRILFFILYLQRLIPSNLMLGKIIFRVIASKMLEFLTGKPGLTYFFREESLPLHYMAVARFFQGPPSSQDPAVVIRGGHSSFTEHSRSPHTHAQIPIIIKYSLQRRLVKFYCFLLFVCSGFQGILWRRLSWRRNRTLVTA